MNIDTKKKLKQISVHAKQRFDYGDFAFKVEGSVRYVRVTSGGFRAISIDHEAPCKSLMKPDEKKVGQKSSIEKSIDDARNPAFNNSIPKTNQPEQRVQAFIIREMLLGGKTAAKLAALLGVDKLVFVTDELSVDDIRADMVLVGHKNDNDKVIPVFIELKAARLAEKLTDQLNDIVDYAKKYQAEFSALLLGASGIKDKSIDFDGAISVVIWPLLESGKERQEAHNLRKGRIAVSYEEDPKGSGNYTFH